MHPFAIYGGKGHAFDTWPRLMETDMKDAYIWLLFLWIIFAMVYKQ